MKEVKILTACVTSEGDRFVGDKYSGDGKKALVDAGLAEWIPDPVEVEEEPIDLVTDEPGENTDVPVDELTDDDSTDTADGNPDEVRDDPEESGSDDDPSVIKYSLRKLCSVDGCRRMKTGLCPSCSEPICPDHMDEEAGMCLLCIQGDDD